MLEGVSITCFASSYLVALVLEVTRLVFRSGIRGAALLGFAGAGLLAHTVFLLHHALQTSGAPLSSQQDWYLLSAWVLVAGYIGLTCRQRKNVLGLFLLPLVLLLVGTAAWFADPRRLPGNRPYNSGDSSTAWRSCWPRLPSWRVLSWA